MTVNLGTGNLARFSHSARLGSFQIKRILRGLAINQDLAGSDKDKKEKMLEILKKIIEKAAIEAVFQAEARFASGEGKAKKEAAIAYVTKALPVPNIIKPLLARILATTIDYTIESIVATMNSRL